MRRAAVATPSRPARPRAAMPHRVRITIRWSRPLRRGLAATLSGVVISIVSLVLQSPQAAPGGRHVHLRIELRAEEHATR